MGGVGVYFVNSGTTFGPVGGLGEKTNPIGIWEKETDEKRTEALNLFGCALATNQLVTFKSWQYEGGSTFWASEITVGKAKWTAAVNPNRSSTGFLLREAA